MEGLSRKGSKIINVRSKRNERGKEKIEYIKKIEFYIDKYKAIEGAEVMIVITEWSQFIRLDFARIKKVMKDNYFFI